MSFIPLTHCEYKEAPDPANPKNRIAILSGVCKRHVRTTSIQIIEEDEKYGTFVVDFTRPDGKKIGFYVKESAKDIIKMIREIE